MRGHIQVVGHPEGVHVDPEFHDFASLWTWYAIPGPSRPHAVTVVNDFVVDLHYLTLWAGLTQGYTMCEHGGLKGQNQRQIPAADLREMLEAELERASMEELVEELIMPSLRAASATRRDSPPVKPDDR